MDGGAEDEVGAYLERRLRLALTGAAEPSRGQWQAALARLLTHLEAHPLPGAPGGAAAPEDGAVPPDPGPAARIRAAVGRLGPDAPERLTLDVLGGMAGLAADDPGLKEAVEGLQAARFLAKGWLLAEPGGARLEVPAYAAHEARLSGTIRHPRTGEAVPVRGGDLVPFWAPLRGTAA